MTVVLAGGRALSGHRQVHGPLDSAGQSQMPIALLPQPLDLSLQLGDPLLRTLDRAAQMRLATA